MTPYNKDVLIKTQISNSLFAFFRNFQKIHKKQLNDSFLILLKKIKQDIESWRDKVDTEIEVKQGILPINAKSLNL